MKACSPLRSFRVCLLLAGIGAFAPAGAQSTAPLFANGFETVPSVTQVQWRIATNFTVSRPASDRVAPYTCVSLDPVALTVAADCGSMTGWRLGNVSYTINDGANTQTFTVKVTPQHHPLLDGFGGSSRDSTLFVVTGAGEVVGWGANGYSPGQDFVEWALLGRGAAAQAVQSSASADYAIAAGGGHLGRIASTSVGFAQAGAVSDDGEVLLWGLNSHLRNDGTDLTLQYTPTRMLASAGGAVLNHVVQLALGQFNKTVLLDTGTVLSWGRYIGQNTGDDTVNFPAPVRLPGGAALTGIVQIASQANAAMALGANGQVYSWGANDECELGHTTSTANCPFADVARPVVLQATGQPLTNIVSIAAGDAFGLALGADGHVYAWGRNVSGSAGATNVFDYQPGAIAVSSAGGALSNIVSIAATGVNGHAMTASGEIWAWGDPAGMAQGDTSFCACDSGAPIARQVRDVANTGVLSGAIAIGSGFANGLALMPDGRVLVFGAVGGQGAGLGQGTASAGPEGLLPRYVAGGAVGSGSLNLGNLSGFQNPRRRYR